MPLRRSFAAQERGTPLSSIFVTVLFLLDATIAYANIAHIGRPNLSWPWFQKDRGTDTNKQSSSPPWFGKNDIDDENTIRDRKLPWTTGDHDQSIQNPNPVVYRYYGKKLVSSGRLHISQQSIPILLLGPNVDHWKTVAQELASRGYNVLACERVALGQGQDAAKRRQSSHRQQLKRTHHPSVLVSAAEATLSSSRIHRSIPGDEPSVVFVEKILNAFQWSKVLVVACDVTDTRVAIEAAIQLAPDRIAGLILCGRLVNPSEIRGIELESSQNGIDRLLGEKLRCPFTIVWDGVISEGTGTMISLSVNTEEYSIGIPTTCASRTALADDGKHRSLVLGGGVAPHRKRPELLAWTISRFVEEHIAPKSPPVLLTPRKSSSSSVEQNSTFLFGPMINVNEFLASGTWIVTGRILATIIFYGSILRTLLVQYDHVSGDMIHIETTISKGRSLNDMRTRTLNLGADSLERFYHLPQPYAIIRWFVEMLRGRGNAKVEEPSPAASSSSSSLGSVDEGKKHTQNSKGSRTASAPRKGQPKRKGATDDEDEIRRREGSETNKDKDGCRPSPSETKPKSAPKQPIYFPMEQVIV